MGKSIGNNIKIKNKKASWQYFLTDKLVAGLVLTGTEIKSIRHGKANIGESYCVFEDGELFVRGMHISEYDFGNIYNHIAKRDRKLLLTSRELRKLYDKVKDKGMTIIPVTLFINDRGLAKLEIALAKGKHFYDKRENLREKDSKREIDRQLKKYR